MATVVPARRRRPESFRAETQSFRIHEDAPSTQDTDDTEMNESAVQDDDEPDQEDAQESEDSESSEEDAPDDSHFQQDMERLQNCFVGFRQKYRLIKRIGEGWHAPRRRS